MSNSSHDGSRHKKIESALNRSEYQERSPRHAVEPGTRRARLHSTDRVEKRVCKYEPSVKNGPNYDTTTNLQHTGRYLVTKKDSAIYRIDKKDN